MAKTIKDMADEAADLFGGDEWDRASYTDGYTNGANAVLEEIDNFIFNTIQMKDVIEPRLILIKIRKKFKELKGE